MFKLQRILIQILQI